MSERWLEELTYEECLEFLRDARVGRLAVVADEMPVVLPVNYRVVDVGPRIYLAIRTRPGNVLDQAPTPCAFEVDDIDRAGRRGRSVLVRGQLDRIDESVPTIRERFDSEPWVDERDAWMIVEPYTVTGRRLRGDESWSFHPDAYL